jgi:HK97 family phage major capsid protein
MDFELKQALDALGVEYKGAIGGLKTQLDGLKTGLDAVQRQADAIDKNMQSRHVSDGGGGDGLAQVIFEDEGFKHFAKTGRGRIAVKIDDFQKKTAITDTALGSATSGVLAIDRQTGILPMPMSTFRLRQLLRIVPTELGMVDWVRVLTAPTASPQIEALDKFQGAMTFESVSEKVRTLAHWIPASRQALQDLPALSESINAHLRSGLLDCEDTEIVAGDGTGEHLHGLCHQATAFNTALLSASDGWKRADILGRALQQLASAKLGVTGIVLNPADWWSIILTKDTTGRYIHGDPATMTATRLWGLPVAVTTAISAGTFLVGDFQTGAALFMRMDGVVEVSDSHSDYFIKNMVAIRCEERVLLAVFKPAAFIYGSLSKSPA